MIQVFQNSGIGKLKLGYWIDKQGYRDKTMDDK